MRAVSGSGLGHLIVVVWLAVVVAVLVGLSAVGWAYLGAVVDVRFSCIASWQGIVGSKLGGFGGSSGILPVLIVVPPSSWLGIPPCRVSQHTPRRYTV